MCGETSGIGSVVTVTKKPCIADKSLLPLHLGSYAAGEQLRPMNIEILTTAYCSTDDRCSVA